MTLEAIIITPVLLIASLAIVQFGTTMTVHPAVKKAAREAAREAAKVPNFDPSSDSAVVVAVVNQILGVHGLAVGANTGVLVVIEDSSEVECVGDAALDAAVCPNATSVVSAQEIKVTVFVSIDDAPIPNLLSTFGVDLSTKRFEFAATELRQ